MVSFEFIKEMAERGEPISNLAKLEEAENRRIDANVFRCWCGECYIGNCECACHN